MKKYYSIIVLGLLFSLFLGETGFAQRVLIGPRFSGNLNIYNQKGLTGTYNGLGVGLGGTVDASFSQHIGIMVNLTVFDMKNFSNSQTTNNTTVDQSISLSYISIDPLFKAEFSGFYMTAGPSFGVKLNSSGEVTQVVTGQAPATQPMNLDTKSIRFDIAVGTGYTFTLGEGMFMGTDFMAYIPLTDTYNFPGISNSVFSLKLGVSLKFKL